MEKEEVKGVKRVATTLKGDASGIESFCAQIIFIQKGDTPVTIRIKGTDFTTTLKGAESGKSPDYLTFGSTNSDLIETDYFDIEFGSEVNTKELVVMRVYVKRI